MEDICRTCLSSSVKLISLECDKNLLDKIEILTSVKISLDTNMYPSTICEGCINNLNNFHNFREKVINADKILREHYSNTLSMSKKKAVDLDKSGSKGGKLDESIIIEESTNVKQAFECEIIIIKQEPIDNDNPLCAAAENTSTCGDDQTDIEQKNEGVSDNYSEEISDNRSDKTEKKCNLLNNNGSNPSTPGVCSICGKVVRADHLKKHMMVHSEGPVTCKICNKVLRNSTLRGHMMRHKGYKFTCETCGKCFSMKYDYHRHMRKHADPNADKVTCKLCGIRVRGLKRHLLSHTGERPFVCPICSKGLTSKHALDVHGRQHTDEKPFRCEYCSKAFKQKVSLRMHLKSKHSIGNKMEDVCRTCLSSSAKLFPMESDAGLLEKIEILTSVQISSDTDEYPSTICEGCIENLNKFYCFREIVINADKTLKEKYSISFPTVKKRKATSRKRNYDESRKHRKLNIKALIREKSANVQQKECETAISIKQEPIGFDDPLSCGEDATACEDDNADIKLEIENIIINNKIEASELTEENCKLRQCEECNLTFTSYSTLSNHKRNMHSAPGICTICGVVVRADNLKKHMLVHSEEPVTCKICNRVLKNTGSLRGHLLIHKGETYTCDMCGRCFRVKSEYHRHMRKHDDPNLLK
ncbi:hypothetical protein JTB14_025104 [Gonioctena quinquepunctata]|nr:hypothetical protein JTB14_025104 [Gonioctena quinquepunctata]